MKHLAIPRPIGVRATQYDHRREHQQAGHQEGHRGGDEDREEERVPGGEAGAIAYATITSLVILAGIVLFVWPEIPNAREDWAYTGPLLGIVVVTLAVGEAIHLADRPPTLAAAAVLPRRGPRALPLGHRWRRSGILSWRPRATSASVDDPR